MKVLKAKKYAKEKKQQVDQSSESDDVRTRDVSETNTHNKVYIVVAV